MRILFVTPECAPLTKTGGLGDVSAALPDALRALGLDVRQLLPGYNDVLSGTAGAAEIARLQVLGFDLRLLEAGSFLVVDCPTLYRRDGGPYQDRSGADWADNALRFAVLSKLASLLASEASPLAWRPDCLHCNDWPAALAAAYLAFDGGASAASVVTVHNLAFQGNFDAALLGRLGLPPQSFSVEGLEFHGRLSFLKAGLAYADAITTVSPSYAREIQTREHGVGFDGILRARSSRLRGILNGVDRGLWDPAHDGLLPHRFTREDLAGKARCKAALQKRLHLPADRDAPLFAVVSRLTAQKGIDLVLDVLPGLLKAGAQLAVLGQGTPELQAALSEAARSHPRQVAVTLGFDEGLAHLIEAGADVFLMPSRFEPCGLNQMYSQAYGTPPVVAPVGGLLDSVTDAGADPAHGTGFVMKSCDAAGLEDALVRALEAWRQAPLWRRLQSNGMARDFGWEDSATQYLDVYQAAMLLADGGAASELTGTSQQ